MSNLQCSILILLSLVSTGLSLELCGNGVFKCTSPSTLKICFNGHLVGSEFLCPNSTVCCETSESICSAIPDPSCHDYEYEPNSRELDILIPDIKAKPELDKPGTGNSVCQAQGKFPSFNTNCKKYIMCIKSPTGFREKEMTCYGEKLFDPVSGLCSDTFECAEPTQSTDITDVTPAPLCLDQGKFPIANTNCSKYIMCIKSTTGFREKEMSCYGNKLFDPIVALCSDTYVCNDEIHTTSSSITVPIQTTYSDISTDVVDKNSLDSYECAEQVDILNVEPAAICVAAGKFPVLNIGCKNYIMCIKAPTGFREKIMSCYGEKLFDPATALCSDTYICPEPTQSTPTPFCQEQGKYPVLDTGCKNYIMCTKTTTGFREKPMSCYGEKLFDPETGLCSDTYICPEPMPSTPAPFCQEQGKYPVLDTGCKNYIMCTKTTTGFREKPMSCYGEKLFDPETRLCSDTYMCPEPMPSTPAPFCQEQGKYPVLDTGCKNYIMCTKTTTGFREKPMSCYGGKLFDPETGLCSDTYMCPEPMPSTPAPFCQEQGKYPVLDTGCKNYIMCTKTTTGFREKPMSCYGEKLFDPETGLCSDTYICPEPTPSTPAPFCQEQGKFPMPNSKCTKYINCIKATNGFREKEMSCYGGKLFDPIIGLCSDSYICDEFITSTTEVTPNKSNSTDDCINTESTTTFHPTVTVPVPQLPFCDKMGKFAIPNTECTQYLYCVKTSTGFQGKVYNCPLNSYFNPSTSKCATAYICPEIITTTTNPSNITEDTTFSSTTTSENPTPSVTSTPDLIFTPSSTISPEISTIPDVMTPDVTTTSDIGTTPGRTPTPDLTTASDKTTTINSTPIPTCQVQGKHAIPGTKCRKYLMCLTTTTGFWSMQYTCPNGSLFDPDKKLCTVNYQCSETEPAKSTDATSTSTATVPTTTNNATTEIPFCEMQGIFPVSNSNCKKYLLCIITVEGLWGRIYDCLPNTSYDPVLSQCTKTYECEDSIPTTTEVAKPTEIPECIDQGRIYVPDTGCKQFVLCSLTRSGFKSQVYSCPPATYFNSEDGRCYSDFNCPELKSETQNTDVTICATVGRFPDPQDNNCEYYYTCTEVLPNSIEGVKQKCNSGYYFDAKTQVCSKNYVCEHKLDMKKSVMKVISPKLLKFDRCTTTGRWEVSGSKCKNYVLCTANTDGTLKATTFTCPTTTVFNQAIQKCTAQYTCPDNICFMPGLIPNPNDKDCNSYICCESTIDNIGNVINTGYVKYCPIGCKFNPATGCDPTYVCPK